MRNHRIVLATVASLALIVGMTLTPDPPWLHFLIAELVGEDPAGISLERINNVLLFVPLGMVIGTVRTPWWLLGATALSIAIELSQFLLPDRSPKVADVVSNVIGAVLGYLLVVAFRALRDRRRHRRGPPDAGSTGPTEPRGTHVTSGRS